MADSNPEIQSYLETVRRRFRQVTMQGIAARENIVEPDLEQVFVMPRFSTLDEPESMRTEWKAALEAGPFSVRLQLEKGGAMDAGRESVARALASMVEEDAAETLSTHDREWIRGWLEQFGLHRQFTNGPFDWANLREPEPIAVLGDPGSGKSTLLQALLLTAAGTKLPGLACPALAGRLPVLFHLTQHLSFLDQKSGNEDLLAYLFSPEYHGNEGIDPPGAGADTLRKQRLVLLLDGYDELTAGRDDLDRLLATLPPDVWVVLSSRFHGFDAVRFGQYRRIRVEPFNRDQLTDYLLRWSRTMEQAGLVSYAMTQAEIRDQLDRNPYAVELGGVPLMAAILAMVLFRRTRLPEGKVELMQAAVEIVGYHWEQAKRKLETKPGRELSMEQHLRICQAIAWHLQKETADNLLPLDKVEAITVDVLQEEWGQREAEAARHRFAELIRGRIGLFVEKRAGMYGFVHLQFQEYLAAAHARTARRWGPADFVRHCLDNPRWREVLFFGYLLMPTPADRGYFLRLVREAEWPYEDIDHRRLRQALSFLTADAGVSHREVVSLVTEAVDTLQHAGCARARQQMAEVMGACRQQTAVSTVVSEILPLLTGDNREVHQTAVQALKNLGRATVVPEILPLLKDHDHDVRRAAVEALVNLGDATVVPKLLPLLKDDDSDVRHAAMVALVYLGDETVVPEILPLLKDDNILVRHAAVGALVNLGDATVVPDILPLLTDDESDVRYAAVEALGRLGDATVVPEILPLLTDDDSDVRDAAVEALGRLGDATVVPEILPLLKDKDWRVRRGAVGALGIFGDATVVPEILPLLTDDNWEVRYAAVEALRRLGDATVVPKLLPLLKDDDWQVRRGAVEALGRFGDETVVPEIVPLLKDDSDVRRSAAKALGRLGDATVVPEILPLLKDDDWEVRQTAVEALVNLGDATVVPEILPLLKDKDWRVRRGAVGALGIFGDATVVPEILPLLTDDNWEVRYAAVEALRRLGDATVVPKLLPLLKDDDWQVRRGAVEALGRFGDETVVPEILPLLTDDNWEVRRGAVEALAELGDATLVPEILPLLTDDNWEVRQTAAKALRRLGPQKQLAIRSVLADAYRAQPDIRGKLYPVLEAML